MPGKPRPEICIVCKGARRLCGLSYCPLLGSLRYRLRAYMGIRGDSVAGSTPPSLVVGEYGYPRVRLYYGVPPDIHGEKAKIYDDPNKWFLRYDLTDIISLRSNLLNLVLDTRVYNPYELYEKEIGLAVVSIKPVDTEALLRDKPEPRIVFDPFTPPRGPAARAENIRVSDNPVLPRKLEKLLWDDVRAGDAVWSLYRDRVDFYTIVRAFSIGFLGGKGRRRLVPTRWAITAVDSIVGNTLLKQIRRNPVINNTRVYYGEYLYNKYLVILAPGTYSAMWVEAWMPSSLWNPGDKPSYAIVYEDWRGRVSEMDGGYYAARTSVLEYLYSIGRQARVVIIRRIEPQYIYPVGNWQIRLTVKHALSSKPLAVNPTIGELVEIIKSKTGIPEELIKQVINFIHGNEITLDKWFK
ncbi:MAG: Nre family DNA repair protein [Thermoprotei archaeon]